MTKTLRIAFATGHYLPSMGGIESHVENIATRLAAQGHHVELFTQTDNAAWPVHEDIDGVRVHRHRVPIPSRHLAVSPGLWAGLLARRTDFDVFHAHGYHSIVPLLATAAACRPLVFTPHYHGTGHSPMRRQLHRPYRVLGAQIVRSSRRVICVSKSEADLFLSHFPGSAGTTVVIPNGVDVTALRAARPISAPGTVVVSAGRLETYKQVDKTIRAIRELDEQFSLIITGDGPDRLRLEGLAKQLDLADRVRFLGRIDVNELYGWFQRADVYVSMSSNEAMPVTIVEMLAAGTRVVASDIPAHRDIQAVTKGAITRVDLDADESTLAQAIREAAKSPAVAEQNVASWDDVTERTLEVYRSVAVYG